MSYLPPTPCSVTGMKLSSLLGKKGSLDKLQSYWDVGFFLGASILACDNTRVIQASEKLFKLKAPIWWVTREHAAHFPAAPVAKACSSRPCCSSS